MFPGFLLNLSLFLSPALGQLGVGPLRHASGMTPPPKGEARLGFLQTPGGLLTRLPLWGRYVPVGRCPAADRGGSRDAGAVRRLRGQGAAGRERRGKAPVSLAFFYALRAYKVKGKVAPF